MLSKRKILASSLKNEQKSFKGVADVLGYQNGSRDINRYVDTEDRDAVPIQDSIGRMQNTPVINESGLYSLILSSKLPMSKSEITF